MSVLKIYTDGACTANGKPNARGGVGVFFCENDERNISQPLKGPVQTNQRAELTAFILALTYCADNPTLSSSYIIYTDSKYCKDGYQSWLNNWIKRDWTNAKGQPVKNQDLWRQVLVLKEHLEFVDVSVEWVKGHSKNPGNEGADRLAVQGIP